MINTSIRPVLYMNGIFVLDITKSLEMIRIFIAFVSARTAVNQLSHSPWEGKEGLQ